ncbi:MAG TPA: hypothetical protein VFI99_16300 [Nocardioides sp.]|nr:hypothetical protein [Nocardioides sp.]
MSRVVLVPGTLALLPEYAGIEDPVAALRATCLEAVGWLGAEVSVLADEQGARVAAHLLASTPRTGDEPSYLVVGNGSACRTEKAPGYLDERATGFDADLARALTAPDPAALAAIDPETSAELLAATDGIRSLGDVLTPDHVATVDYDDDPYGVQYWVVRWTARLP